ncbi:MAG: hypothetical protein CSA33_08425 [Desulfobulbus propionicus]|nr:MAG: hypothetical protein CSA33_08425 [Desulfobulbus propionicus]
MKTSTSQKEDGARAVHHKSTLGFHNSYAKLPRHFYQQCFPTPVAAPHVITYNQKLAYDLDIDLSHLSPQQLTDLFSGNTVSSDSQPLAMVYAGHQFGYFVPQLGDGRAILLGEKRGRDGNRYDIQLKGAGRTAFSRGGDGRSALGPVLREYIVSEAMHKLGIPTTRALAMVTTGETVLREKGLIPGGILTRAASGFVRIGTFEYFLAREDYTSLQQLADYCINRHYPRAQHTEDPYLNFFQLVCDKQAKLVAQWMRVGFIHGVMNTDNTAVSGETIDYGPCAFMDHYNPEIVFSSIDKSGRYRFSQQSNIIVWNLTSLGNCLLPIMTTETASAIEAMQQVLASFQETFLAYWQQQMNTKVGLSTVQKGDQELVQAFLHILFQQEIDYTLAFRYLSDMLQERGDNSRFLALFQQTKHIQPWLKQWHKRLEQESTSFEQIRAVMNRANPAFIPRNHRIEHALQRAEQEGDLSEVHTLNKILATPYEEQPENAEYMHSPQPEERILQTFCGT